MRKVANNSDAVTEFEFLHTYVKGIKIEMTKLHEESEFKFGITHV
jgi:phosphatidylethanolamine-binding protein (PEBP) family uncharacterized protein